MKTIIAALCFLALTACDLKAEKSKEEKCSEIGMAYHYHTHSPGFCVGLNGQLYMVDLAYRHWTIKQNRERSQKTEPKK